LIICGNATRRMLYNLGPFRAARSYLRGPLTTDH
jgi:hypothetical protein